MLRLAFDFIITWRETRTRPNAYHKGNKKKTDRHHVRHLFPINGKISAKAAKYLQTPLPRL